MDNNINGKELQNAIALLNCCIAFVYYTPVEQDTTIVIQ